MTYDFDDVTPTTFFDNILVAFDYFGVSSTAAPVVRGYVKCSGLNTLVGTSPLDLVSGGTSVLTSGFENEFKKAFHINRVLLSSFHS